MSFKTFVNVLFSWNTKGEV